MGARRWAALVPALGLLATWSVQVHAQGNTASATGIATATVVSPLAIVELADLDFGTIAAGTGSGGTATLSPMASGVTWAGSAGPACSTTSACAQPHAARFAVSGEPERTYVITLPANLAVLPQDGEPGAVALTVGDFKIDAESQSGSGSRRKLDATGADGFEVGATLIVPAGATPGRYRTSLPIMVTYG